MTAEPGEHPELDRLIGGKYVVDANILATCGARWLGRGASWVSVPPSRRPEDLCTLAIADDAYDDWALWLSPKLIDLAGRVLRGELGTQFRERPFGAPDVEGYEQELREIAVHSGGGIVEPQSRIFGLFGDSEDDWNVGSLAVSVGADVVVSHDNHVTSLGQATLPMLGGKDRLVLFVDAQEFVDHVISTRTGPQT